MDDEQYIESGLSVGAVKIVDTNGLITEEELNYINNKIAELDESVSVIENEIEEINSSMEQLDNIKNDIEEVNLQLENKINKTYINNEVFKIVRPSDNLNEIMENEDIPLRLLKGKYIIDKPLKFNNCFEGVGLKDVVIAPSENFKGEFLVDFANGGERKYIKRITFDMSYKNISAFGSSIDGSGSSCSLFEELYFICGMEKYPIKASSNNAVSGMLTGSTFLNCHFNGNSLWCDLGVNQDDITFLNCRFAMDGSSSNQPMLKCNGTNIQFNGCYFALKSTDYNISGVKAIIEIGGNLTTFKNCFFETVGESNITNLIFVNHPTCNISLENIHCNIIAPSFKGFIRYGIGDNSGLGNINVSNFTGKPNFPNCSILELFNGVNGATHMLNLSFNNVDVFNNLVVSSNGSYDTNNCTMLKGVFKGESYSNSFRYDFITGETPSPCQKQFTFPYNGIWIVNVVSKVYNDNNHAIMRTFIVNYFNGIYKIATVQPIGIAVRTNTDYNLTDLEMSLSPEGVATITTTSTGLGSLPYGISVKCNKLMAI